MIERFDAVTEAVDEAMNPSSFMECERRFTVIMISLLVTGAIIVTLTAWYVDNGHLIIRILSVNTQDKA